MPEQQISGSSIRAQDLIESEHNAVGRRAVDGPMPFVDLPDPQRPRERQAVRGTAHFSLRSDDIDIAKAAHRLFERGNTFGMDAVIVRYQDLRSYFLH